MTLTVSGTTSYTFSRGDTFDTLTVNDTKYAIFQKTLHNSNHYPDLTVAAKCHCCVFLEAMEAEHDITIDAVNILALGSFHAKTGKTRIHAKRFYGVGIECKGSVSIYTTGDIVISGQYGHTNSLHLEGRKIDIDMHFGLPEKIHEIATEIKRLFSLGIEQKTIVPLVQAFLMAQQILDDPTGKKVINYETLLPDNS